MCFYGHEHVCVLGDGAAVCVCARVRVCVASCGSEWGMIAFAWFAAGHTVHSGTVTFVP